MIKHFFKTAFIQGNWTPNVLITLDEKGLITAIERDSAAGNAVQHDAPAVPGMPNLHSHAFQRAMAGLGEVAGPSEDSFWSWRDVMYKFLHHLTPDDFEAIAAQLYMEMLKAGFTGVGEFHYLHHQAGGTPYADKQEMSRRLMAAAENTGIHLSLLPVLYSFGGFGSQAPTEGQGRFIHSTEDFLNLVEGLQAHETEKDYLNVGVAPHSLRATDAEQLKILVNSLPKRIPIHIHIAEQVKEVQDCLDWSGKRPVDWLLSNIDIDDRWCLVHATHVDQSEYNRIAEAGAVVGLCSVTEANLGDGLFPVNPFMDKGGFWGIGTDSNINISLAEECRILEYGQRLQRLKRTLIADRGQSNGERLFSEALEGGRRALRPDLASAFSIGAPADFVLLNTEDPALLGKNPSQLLDAWVFAGNNNAVSSVFVKGQQVVDKGHHIHEEGITRRFKDVMNRLISLV